MRIVLMLCSLVCFCATANAQNEADVQLYIECPAQVVSKDTIQLKCNIINNTNKTIVIYGLHEFEMNHFINGSNGYLIDIKEKSKRGIKLIYNLFDKRLFPHDIKIKKHRSYNFVLNILLEDIVYGDPFNGFIPINNKEGTYSITLTVKLKKPHKFDICSNEVNCVVYHK